MADLITVAPADRLSYPGLLPEEVLVLKAWLVQHQAEYDRFEYNVRIGSGEDPGPRYDDSTRKQAIANTQKRVDAVAYKGDSPTLIEVKRRASSTAVGQLVTYGALWPVTFPGSTKPPLLLVAATFNQDILAVLSDVGISLNLVEVDFGVLKRR